MPSMRRVKVFGLLVLLFVVTLLFWTASLRQQRNQDIGDFYSKTKQGLDKKPMRGTTKTDDEEVAKKMAERLKEAAEVAKSNANAKAPKPDPPSSLVGVGSAAQGSREEKSVAGRKKFSSGDTQEPVKEETQEEHDVEVELNTILKKSPIIIFSKSYCPHSRRAKGILLEKYIIDPAPFVVELDQHPLGAGIQARLAELSGRRTVPNILVNAVSIGGGDDIANLDDTKQLVWKIQDLAGKRVTVKQRPIVEEEGHGLR